MGVILSIIVASKASIKKIQGKRKASKTRKAHGPQDEAQNTPQPSSLLDQSRALAPTTEGRSQQHEHEHDHEHRALPTPGQPRGAAAESRGAENLVGAGAINDARPPAAAEAEEGDHLERSGVMASDEDYAAFLDKANADPNEGVASKGQGGSGRAAQVAQLRAVDEGVEIPAGLREVTKGAFYTSDADEPFEAVGLKFKGKGLPDEATFAKLVNHPSPEDAEVSILDIGEWDVQGQYKDLVEATREATRGSDVRVYKISRGRSRVEYWVVGAVDGKLLGVKALAIES